MPVSARISSRASQQLRELLAVAKYVPLKMKILGLGWPFTTSSSSPSLPMEVIPSGREIPDFCQAQMRWLRQVVLPAFFDSPTRASESNPSRWAFWRNRLGEVKPPSRTSSLFVTYALIRFYLAQQHFGLNGHLLTGQQARNADHLDILFASADRTVAILMVFARLFVSGDDAFIIAQDHAVWALRDLIIRHNRDLTPAAGCIH